MRVALLTACAFFPFLLHLMRPQARATGSSVLDLAFSSHRLGRQDMQVREGWRQRPRRAWRQRPHRACRAQQGVEARRVVPAPSQGMQASHAVPGQLIHPGHARPSDAWPTAERTRLHRPWRLAPSHPLTLHPPTP